MTEGAVWHWLCPNVFQLDPFEKFGTSLWEKVKKLTITKTTFNLAGGGEIFSTKIYPKKILLLIFCRKKFPTPPQKALFFFGGGGGVKLHVHLI